MRQTKTLTLISGYYSNHDSSVSTLTNEIRADKSPGSRKTPVKYSLPRPRLISTPNPNLAASDSSSSHSDQSSASTATSSSTPDPQIVHIEIINNFESLSSLDSESMTLFSNSVTERVLETRRETEARQNCSFRIENNELLVNEASFNKMHKFRYKKRLLRQQQQQVSTFKPDVGVSLGRYERFSRNLNTSIASLHENSEGVCVEADEPGLNRSHCAASVDSVRPAEAKSKSMNDLVGEKPEVARGCAGGEGKTGNVRELISRFEQQRAVCGL